MYHFFFIHSSVDGHLGCFQVLAIINSVQRALFSLQTQHYSMVLIITFLSVNGPGYSMGWMSSTFLNHFLFAGQLSGIFFFLNIYLKHLYSTYWLPALFTSITHLIRSVIRSSYYYYFHFTDEKVKSEELNPLG